jgi:DNA-binding NarL/FixJ family response regulator
VTNRDETGRQHPERRRNGDEADPLTVVVADDHALMREGILRALDPVEDIRVIDEVADGVATLASLERERPDVCLLDLRMPRMDGFTCLEHIQERWPELPVLILTMEDDPAIAREALDRGAAGYVNKAVRPADLASMVRTAARGRVLFASASPARTAPGATPAAGTASPSVSAPLAEPAGISPLTELSPREREILALICQGKTNKEIASVLFITPKTVKYHLTHVFAKLGVANRTEACSVGLRHAL